MRDIWNNPLSRMFIPDKISLNLSTSVTAYVGFSEALSFTWITRGHDEGLVPYVLMTVGVQGGPAVSAEALIGIEGGYYVTTDLRSLQKGAAAKALKGWSAYGSVKAGVGVGTALTGSIGFSEYPFISRPTWISSGIGFGPSLGGGATGGVSYTLPIFESQFE